MDYGFVGFNNGPLHNGDSIERVVLAAEELGYESLWTGEHLLLPDPHVEPSPVAPDCNFVDTIASLAFAAGKTERIKLGSGVLLISQRDPIVLAKELAGIDVLSKGRLLVGVGVGYVPQEFEALGIPFEERGARTSEHIEVLRALWTQEKPSFDGRFTKFSGIQSHPRPAQKPHPPIIVGGDSEPALRRAVSQGDGYYWWSDLEETAERLSKLREVAKSTERPASLGRLEITITPPGAIDRDTARRYEDLGVDRLVLIRDPFEASNPPSPAADEAILRFLEEQAGELGIG